jgi:hypothetical protein
VPLGVENFCHQPEDLGFIVHDQNFHWLASFRRELMSPPVYGRNLVRRRLTGAQ